MPPKSTWFEPKLRSGLFVTPELGVSAMKVLIADKFEKVGIDGLKELGCTVVSQPEVKADALPALIREVDPHILIVREQEGERRGAAARAPRSRW